MEARRVALYANAGIRHPTAFKLPQVHPIQFRVALRASSSSTDDDWDARFEELKAHKAATGYFVPSADNQRLARWVRRQQKTFHGNKMAANKKARLEEIGFRNDVFDQAWDKRIADLEDYIADKGHALVPTRYTGYNKLGAWVAKTRSRRSGLTNERAKQLDELGFIWDPSQMVWEQRIAELKIFKAEHNHCDVPKSYQSKQLASWVKEVRRSWRRKTLTAERIAQLDELGLTWDMRDAEWQTQAKRVQDHFAQNGTWASMDKPLKAWVSDQRRKKQLLDAGEETTLTASRVATLERIGVFNGGD